MATERCNYYNANLEPKLFDVLARNADGTIDLGAGDVKAVVGCRVATVPTVGCATLGEKVPLDENRPSAPVVNTPSAPPVTSNEAAAAAASGTPDTSVPTTPKTKKPKTE